MKPGKKMLSDRQSNNSRFSLAMAREYSDLYRAADAHFEAKKEAQNALDEAYETRRYIQSRINAHLAVRKFFGLSEEDQERLDMMFELRRLLDKEISKMDPNFVKKERASKEDRQKNTFLDEVRDLSLKDTRFLPKEVKDIVSKHKAFIKDMKVVGNNGRAYALVKCPDTIEFHWVEL